MIFAPAIETDRIGGWIIIFYFLFQLLLEFDKCWFKLTCKVAMRSYLEPWIETEVTFCNLSKLRYGLNGLITVQL